MTKHSVGMTNTAYINSLVDDRPKDLVFRVDKSAFLEDAVFDLEIEKIFEGGWVYLCHESQVRSPGDYFTTYIGRQPVAVIRQKDGGISGYLNVCPHRASILLPLRQGSLKSTITCRFHGWVFSTGGKCLKVKFDETGNYPGGKPCGEQVDLTALGGIASYRGFIFGSLRMGKRDLAHYLGPASTFLDLLVDQSPQGLEILRGSSTYVVRHNWKIEVENVVDGYHTPTVHRVFGNTMLQRAARSSPDGLQQTETGRIWGGTKSGCYDLGNGHMAIWTERASPEASPLATEEQRLNNAYGSTKAEWMLRRGRNLLVFPNLVVNDLASTHIRTARPISADRTEISLWCIAPIGESRESRYARLRKFEDFFLVTGMATADDVVSLDCVQAGSEGRARQWIDYARGYASVMNGPDPAASDLGFVPVTSNSSFDHETTNHGFWRQWRQTLTTDVEL